MEAIKPPQTSSAQAHEAPALDENRVLASLTALAQTQRLRAFRALVVAGSDGLTPGAMAALCAVVPPERACAQRPVQCRATRSQPDLPRQLHPNERCAGLFDRALLRGSQ